MASLEPIMFYSLVYIFFLIRLVNKTCTIALVLAGTQKNQFASVIDCAGNITSFTQNRASKSFFFFWRLKRGLSSNFCVCHKKSKIINWTKHSITTIYMQDPCNVILQSFKSFQLQTFLFFLILEFPFLS